VKKLCLLTGACLLAVPALLAQNNRSAVSLSGADINPCTPASPCRSFVAAIAVTNPGGEIIALDSGGYGPFAVTIPVTISGAPGVHAAIAAPAAPAMTINAGSSDKVTIRNIVMIGAGANYGINIVNAGTVEVFGCLVRGFNAFGIFVNTSAAMVVQIDNVWIADNTSAGIFIEGDFAGVNSVRTTVSNSSLYNNGDGIRSDYGTKTVITNCTIADDSNSGVTVNSNISTGLSADATIEGCTISNNNMGTFVGASGTNNTAKMTLSNNLLSFNATAVTVSVNGVANSFADNRFAANISDGSPLGAASFK